MGCMGNLADINYGLCHGSDVCFRDSSDPSLLHYLNVIILLHVLGINTLVHEYYLQSITKTSPTN